MRPRPAVLFVPILVCVLAACAGIRLNSREPVQGSSGAITSSPYEPEDSESCRSVGQEKCRYWNSPFKSVQSQCAESLVARADELGANYILVDQANSRVGGFATSSPIATLYRCERPIQR